MLSREVIETRYYMDARILYWAIGAATLKEKM